MDLEVASRLGAHILFRSVLGLPQMPIQIQIRIHSYKGFLRRTIAPNGATVFFESAFVVNKKQEGSLVGWGLGGGRSRERLSG